MTCQELRLYLEDPLRSAGEFRVETEHLVHCAECARFVETQRQLGVDLRRFREALPLFPEKLDANVLANYRRDVINSATVQSKPPSRHRIAVLCLTGVAAALVLVAVAFSSFRPRGANPVAKPQPPELTAMPQSVALNPTARLSSSAKVRSSHPAMGQRPPRRPATTSTLLSPSFRSLMYCDELSCSGAMDVIRVRLPSLGIGSEPASKAAGGTVIADVLVGPDGIARGIRIVE